MEISTDTEESTRNGPMRCYLVRTIPELIERSIVGIGWSDHDFSSHPDAESAIKAIDSDYGIGRWGNQIRRFFDIQEGDIIVAPLPYSVAIGRATGSRFSDPSYYNQDRLNQRKVAFPRDSEGRLITCPRNDFSEAFQRRIRVRGMTVNDLSEFGDEITRALVAAEEGNDFSWSHQIAEEVTKREDAFKVELLSNIQSGKTNLQTGGIGLEYLVRELLTLDGYQAVVLSKRALGGFADADVKASRTDRCASIEILVQVKHHQGFSGDYGIQQLLEIRKEATSVYSTHELVFLTSASVSAELLEQAIAADITVIDGDGLVGWIAEKIDVLSEQTKRMLGICEVPSIVQPH